MNISHSIPSTVTGISFSFLTTDDVKRISVKQIVNPVLLDDLNRPNNGGLYDPALGPSERNDICATCRLSYFTCPGHFGHIELPAPVFHPLFMSNMLNLLRGTCLFCHQFKMSRTVLWKYMAKLKLLERGLLDAAQGVDDIHIRVSRRSRDKDAMDVDVPAQTKSVDETPEQFMMRLNLYVALQIRRASTSKRDNYKDGLVYQTRKDVIHDFLKSTSLNRCQNEDCGCPAYTFRKEGSTKIIEYDLSIKQKAQLTRRRPDVLALERLSAQAAAAQENATGPPSDVEDEDDETDEGEGDDLTPGANTKDATALPRAANGKVKTKRGRNERVMAPEECRAHLRRLFRKEPVMCALIYGRHGACAPSTPIASADMFFLEVIPVAPTRFRPPAKLNDTLFEHPQNELLAKVLNTCYRLRDLNLNLRQASEKGAEFNDTERRRVMGMLLEALVQLQVDVNSFMDSSKNPAPMRQGKLPPPGVKQGLERKEGLFRKHMMGKRVNYAARSVISPDANIEPNEIGIPPVFARKLTFPEPVTHHNVNALRQLVINGPRNHPGAAIIEHEDGHKQSLDKLTVEQRTALANQLMTPQGDTHNRHGLSTRTPAINKKVYRHLQDGDMLILNRQPTLHKPSMMTHRAKVLQGEKTIRMHYANCNSYNADFDGDEMNIHFPQNEIARAEATFIANTDNQYLVPTSGNPLRGLIQDHVVAGVWMTCQDAFFEREEYFQLLYGALRPEDQTVATSRIVTLPPTIWKPRPLWTGKQIISTVLKNVTPTEFDGITLNAKTKVPGKLWGNASKEDKVIFMDGELLCGVLDKAAFGASEYGIVHSVYELYGADVAGRLLGILSRLFTKFLQHRAFTCRMDDLILTPSGDATRRDILAKNKELGTEAAIENFPSLKGVAKEEVPTVLRSLLGEVLRDDNKMAGLDVTVKTRLSSLTSKISDACLPDGLYRKFPHNHMQAMTQSGAKGSAVNVRQISCGLGQQELEGRRVPVMVSGKTLPSFKAFETKAIAGGYVASRFLTGIKPQEFYFHCMAGREGLIDTAVKTSRSGYLQRCLIKHLEGIRVHYDNTVRGSDSSVYQFTYGGDGLDVTKQKHLYQFDFIAQNEVSFVNRLRPSEVSTVTDSKLAASYMKKVLKKSLVREGNTPPPRNQFDPVLSVYNPAKYLGATSEQFATAVGEYAKKNPSKLLLLKGEEDPIKRKKALVKVNNFKTLMNIKYMRSLVEPGEAVGLLASQGVGEPSTQMTLNTFHFAGHGAANVTLGIPRLREIVMTASQKPKTPSMTMKVRKGVSADDIALFCKRASRLTLSQIVDSVTVKERLVVEGDARRTRFAVNLAFFPRDEYATEYDVEPAEILAAFATRFPLTLKKELQAELKKLDADLRAQIQELGKGMKPRETEGQESPDDEDGEAAAAAPRRRDDDEESEDGDGDADEEKRQRQRKQMATYEDDEEEDDDEAQGEMGEEELEAAFASDEEEEKVQKEVKGAKKRGIAKQIDKVRNIFKKNLVQAVDFDFTESNCTFQIEFSSDMPKLLFVGIVERTCKATVVREIKGITDCFAVKDDSKNKAEPEIKLTTNGSNLPGVWDFTADLEESIIDEDDMYSNDIYAILKTYGVEMARAAILREMGGVFGAYNIQVDRRHLELIADYMTFDGGYKPFNRKGISTNSSPLLKASYETTAAFLSDATLYGDYDDLSSPSGNVVMGKPNRIGTGVFDVVMPLPQ